MLVWSLRKGEPQAGLVFPRPAPRTRAMILPWQTGPPMCGQTFSKAVNLPLRQNTPTAMPSTSTTLRPGLGNAAALPIAIRLHARWPSRTRAYGLSPRRYHIARSNRLMSAARSSSLTTSTISVGVILSAETGAGSRSSASALAA